MISTRMLLSSLALIGCVGCTGQSADEQTDKIEVQGQATGAPTQIAPEEVKGQDFIATMLGELDFADASARQVIERGEPQSAKQAAQTLSGTMQAARDELVTIAGAGNLKAEAKAGPTHQTDLAVLTSARGRPLAQAFAQRQLENLTLLVGTMRAYKNGGDNAQLRAWAEQHQGPINERLLDIQTLNAELEEASLPADQR